MLRSFIQGDPGKPGGEGIPGENGKQVGAFLALTCLFPVVLFVYLFISRLFVCLQTILSKWRSTKRLNRKQKKNTDHEN